jgi:hypothetical protein
VPNCGENIDWIVYTEIQPMSYEQSNIFNGIWKNNPNFKGNNTGNSRPI